MPAISRPPSRVIAQKRKCRYTSPHFPFRRHQWPTEARWTAISGASGARGPDCLPICTMRPSCRVSKSTREILVVGDIRIRNVQVTHGAGGVGLLQCTVSLHIIVCVSSRTGHCEKRYPSRRDVRRTRFKGDGFCIAAATLERRSGVF